MNKPRIESVFGIPLYYNQIDNYEKVQQDFDEVLEANAKGELNDKSKVKFEQDPQSSDNNFNNELQNNNYQQHLFETFTLDNFREEININLKTYCDGLNFEWRPYNIDSSWVVFFERGNYGHLHNYGTVDISGVYYLKKDSNDGDIYFRSPISQAQTSLCFNGGDLQVPTRQGGLLLFPGWLNHGVTTHNSDEERISVSFNVVFNR